MEGFGATSAGPELITLWPKGEELLNARFCLECRCTGEPVDMGDGRIDQEKNWYCPLLGGPLCEICCQTEVKANNGFINRLEYVRQKTGKPTTEIYATCMECPHGGPNLGSEAVVIEVS